VCSMHCQAGGFRDVLLQKFSTHAEHDHEITGVSVSTRRNRVSGRLIDDYCWFRHRETEQALKDPGRRQIVGRSAVDAWSRTACLNMKVEYLTAAKRMQSRHGIPPHPLRRT
jgi:hypothetical protein